MRRSLGSARRVGRDGGLRNLKEDFEAQRILSPLAVSGPVSGLRLEVDEDMAYMEAHGRLINLWRLNPTEEEVDEHCNESSSLNHYCNQ